MFHKILIANRGEIALRIIRACKELEIRTVAVYSTADSDSLHVKLADESVCIGPPPSLQSYLNVNALISAAELTDAEAIHPGYGFLAENTAFAEICENCGITFIGPTAESMRLMGDKISARQAMIKEGVPILPGTKEGVKDVNEAINVAKQIGFPVIIKASAGGGGRGMKIVHSPAALPNAFATARAEAQAGFGNPEVYIEKYCLHPRHVEIQVIGDKHGNIVHLGERDCSIQRRHQKLIEESPCTVITSELRKQMGDAAVRAASAVGYNSAGTVEFLVDKDNNYYFMEMNTRIQVEHPVTEEVIDHDLIKEQIKVAAGIPISGKNYFPNMHAIEVRINAEDPYADFRPSPGKITSLHTSKGHGVRVDTHVYSGYTVPPYYDSMIAKLICKAQTREECITKMERALDEFILEGIKTTLPFHKQLMRNEAFRKGDFNTGFLNNFTLEPEKNNK